MPNTTPSSYSMTTPWGKIFIGIACFLIFGILCGIAGYSLAGTKYIENSKVTPISTKSSSTQEVSPRVTSTPIPTQDLYAGWKSYTAPNGSSFKYPANWILTPPTDPSASQINISVSSGPDDPSSYIFSYSYQSTPNKDRSLYVIPVKVAPLNINGVDYSEIYFNPGLASPCALTNTDINNTNTVNGSIEEHSWCTQNFSSIIIAPSTNVSSEIISGKQFTVIKSSFSSQLNAYYTLLFSIPSNEGTVAFTTNPTFLQYNQTLTNILESLKF